MTLATSIIHGLRTLARVVQIGLAVVAAFLTTATLVNGSVLAFLVVAIFALVAVAFIGVLELLVVRPIGRRVE